MPRRSPLIAVFLTVVIDLLGFGIVLPLLPLYGKEYDAHGLTLSMLFVSFSLMQFLTAPLWGRLSDRVGRRPVMLIGLAGSVASYALFGLAPGSPWPLPLLYVSRLVAGTFGGTISTAHAYIADVTAPEQRARGMALIGAAFGIGFTIGPAVGGLGHALSPMAPGLIASGFSAFAFVFAWRHLVEPERHAAHRARTWLDLGALKRALAIGGVGSILVCAFTTVACFALLESTLALLGKERYGFDPLAVGLLFSYFGFWSALCQGLIVRKLLGWVGERALVVAGPLLLGGGLIGLALADSLWMLAVVAPVPVLGFGMLTPSLSSLLSRRTDASEQGGVLGLSQSLQSLARIVGPPVGLTLFESGAPLPFFVGGAAMLVPMFLGIRLARAGVQDRY